MTDVIIEKLQSAVLLAMNPQTPQHIRIEAYNLCENFKEGSTLCSQCGFIMAAKERDPFVRHFGLQLVEHCVKFRWNAMSAEEKAALKSSTLVLISQGTLGILSEHAHIKDALSCIVVEIAKREWPQQWTQMVDELNQIYVQGPTQTELVLRVFLRLVEDVLTLQTVPTQRRRDIIQAFTIILPQLFPSFVNTLSTSLAAYATVRSDPASLPTATEHVRVMLAALQLLTLLVDWAAVTATMLLDNDSLLLQLLCRLLSADFPLRLAAVECLLAISGRKGKVEDRRPLLIFFSTDVMSVFLSAAQSSFETKPEHEESYLFLKKFSHFLTSIGHLLSSTWGVLPDVQEPVTFPSYLEAVFAFTQHPSQTLSSTMQSVWMSFLSHEEISRNANLRLFLPRLLQTIRKSFVKVGFPSMSNSVSCEFSRLDFDSDEEFSVFFSKYRVEYMQVLRSLTGLLPDDAMRYAVECVAELVAQPIIYGNSTDLGNSGEGVVMCNPSSPSVLEWDAHSFYLDNVVGRVVTSDKAESLAPLGVSLLRSLLALDIKEPTILSSLLTTISSLFPFISNAQDLLAPILDRIFAAVVYNVPGQTKSSRCRPVKNVRRHATSLFIKLCKLFPVLLQPNFEQLCCHVQQLISDQEQLSNMERCSLNEGLILISNSFCDFTKQESFIRDVLAPIKTVWLSNEMRLAVRSVDRLISLVGLDRPAVEPSTADSCGIWRSQIQYCTTCILAVLKRCCWPDDVEAAIAGGFLLQKTESGTPVLKNPASGPLKELLDNVLALSRSLNDLWLPENRAKCHVDFAQAFDLTPADKATLLGVLGPAGLHAVAVDTGDVSSGYRQPVERMQSFFTVVQENCCHIFGNIGQAFGWQFYSMPNLAATLCSTLLANVQWLPEFRLRLLVRQFLKSFIHFCPSELYADAVLPILSGFCPCIYEVTAVCVKWKFVSDRCAARCDPLRSSDGGDGADDRNREVHEIIEDQLLRQLTREYIDVLVSIFREHKTGAPPVALDAWSDEMSVDDSETPMRKIPETEIGELGQLVLQNDDVLLALLLSLLTSLSWGDTASCTKALSVTGPMLKKLLAMDKVDAEGACYFLSRVIVGLHTHGQHEPVQPILLGAAQHTYELLRPRFVDVVNVMLQIDSCTRDALQAFDGILLAPPPGMKQAAVDKRRKEIFRNLAKDAIGKNVSEQFTKEVTIKNLAPMFFRSNRRKTPPVDQVEQRDIGLCALFTPEHS